MFTSRLSGLLSTECCTPGVETTVLSNNPVKYGSPTTLRGGGCQPGFRTLGCSLGAARPAHMGRAGLSDPVPVPRWSSMVQASPAETATQPKSQFTHSSHATPHGVLVSVT